MKDEHDDIQIRATVVEYEDEPDELTFYRADTDGDSWLTEWISAKEGDYVHLHPNDRDENDRRDEHPMGGGVR